MTMKKIIPFFCLFALIIFWGDSIFAQRIHEGGGIRPSRPGVAPRPEIHRPSAPPMRGMPGPPQRSGPISRSYSAPGPRVPASVRHDNPIGSRLEGARRPSEANVNRMREQHRELNEHGADHYWGNGRDFPAKPNHLVQPVGPAHQEHPIGSLPPEHPGGPGRPEHPIGPLHPEHPSGPVHPIGPVHPEHPGGPVRPDGPHEHDNWLSHHHIDHSHITHIQNHFPGYHNYWTNDWFHSHPHAWRPVGFLSPRIWWHRPIWGSLWGWYGGFLLGEAANTYQYNYGDNIVYDGDTVYVNSVPYVSTEQYYNDGMALADEGAETDDSSLAYDPSANSEDSSEQWMPLGSFAILRDPEQETSDFVLQIASNKKGVIRGNIYNQKTDKVQPIEGAVDQKTQRVAFRIVGDRTHLLECGLWNLTQDSLPILIHTGKDKVQTYTLVRLNDPENKAPDDNSEKVRP